MDGLIIHETPQPKLPTMIVAFAGWPDAAESATRAARYLVRKLPAKKFAEIDPEDFYEFTTVRPQTGLLPALNLVWQVVGSGDFDGDGARDVWLRHTTTGQSAVWFLDGTALTAAGQLSTGASTDWQVHVTEDFDGDGKADVVWRNTATGGNAIWFMDGVTIRPESGALAGAPLNWLLAGAADFDGDGDPDLLWRNSLGHNYIWSMQGTSRSVTGNFTTTVGTVWDVVTAEE